MRQHSSNSIWRHIRQDFLSHFDSFLSLALKIFLLVGAALEAIYGNWLMAAATSGVLLAMFVPLFMGYRFGVRIPPEFEFLAVLFVFASLFLGEVQGYYVKYWWWDIALHSGSGLVLGIFGFLLVHVLNEHEDLQFHIKPGFVALFTFMFALGFGALWEIFEFAADKILGTTMQATLNDTMTDLIVDGIGAFVIAVLGYSYLRDRESAPFLGRWVSKFFRMNRRIFRPRHGTGNNRGSAPKNQ